MAAIFLLVEVIIEISGETVYKERACYCQRTTDFLASGTISFIYFSETPANDSLFCLLVETMFQENPSFWLVETDFRANNGFRRKKEKM